MRLIFVAAIPGLDVVEWLRASATLARKDLLSLGEVSPIVVEDFFSMSAIGRADEPDQRLSTFLDLPPDDLASVCSNALKHALNRACEGEPPFAVVCLHPVLYQSETRTFLAPYSLGASRDSSVYGLTNAVFFSLHDDVYDICRRLQGQSRHGNLHMLNPRRVYPIAGAGKAESKISLVRDPLRDIQNLLFLLDWRDRELMTTQTLAASVTARHLLFHRKGRASVFWRLAVEDAPAVYFSHPISQVRRDLTGQTAAKSNVADADRGRRLMDSCNAAATKLVECAIALVEPTSIDEYRIDKVHLSRISRKLLDERFLPPLTPRWALSQDRIGLPDAWSERDGLTCFAERGVNQIKWKNSDIDVKSLGPALDLLEAEVARQITQRDHKLTQQADLVIAYRPFSLPDVPVVTGGVEAEIMAMYRKALRGKSRCQPAIVVVHSRVDEITRRKNEFKVWWAENRKFWFGKDAGGRTDQFREKLESLVTNLDLTADPAKAKDAILTLLEEYDFLPTQGSSFRAAMASGTYSPQERNRHTFAANLIDGNVVRSVLEAQIAGKPSIGVMLYEEDEPNFAARVAAIVTSARRDSVIVNAHYPQVGVSSPVV